MPVKWKIIRLVSIVLSQLNLVCLFSCIVYFVCRISIKFSCVWSVLMSALNRLWDLNWVLNIAFFVLSFVIKLWFVWLICIFTLIVSLFCLMPYVINFIGWFEKTRIVGTTLVDCVSAFPRMIWNYIISLVIVMISGICLKL